MFTSVSFFTAIVYTRRDLIVTFSTAAQFYVEVFSIVLLMWCWSMSPVLLATLANPQVSSFGSRNSFRLAEILSREIEWDFSSIGSTD